MATRQTTHIIKNSNIVNRPLPNVLLQGEPIINTAEGILYFSGVTTSTSEWTPSGSNNNFFEVGSNLYNLKIRNKLISYGGVSGIGLIGKFLSGTTNGFVLADISAIQGTSNDTYITGGTHTNGITTFKYNNGGDFNVVGYSTGYTLTSEGITTTLGYTPLSSFTNTFVTGFTYNSLNNRITLAQNSVPDYSINLTTFSGITVTDLTPDRFVYTTTNGKLITGNATFDGINMVLPTNGSLSVGNGGLVVGAGGSSNVAGIGDLIVHGNITVFGSSLSAFTNDLYVEDSNILLNYNPTGSTTISSIGAGWTIQDGSGVVNSNVNLDIRALNTFSGITIGNIPDIGEYIGVNGYTNRGWVTQLNDIVIRSNNLSQPNGVRLLGEFDILDGGSY